MALWTPSEITTELWLDASDETTITESLGAVSQWDDKSANLNHATQVVSADQPVTGVNTLNTLNVIKFNEQFFDIPSLTGIKSLMFVTNNLNGSINAAVSPIIATDSVSDDHVFVRTNVVDTDYDISIDGASSNSGRASVNGSLTLTSGTNINLGRTDVQNKGANVWYVDFTNAATIDFVARLIAPGLDAQLIGDIGELILLTTVPSEADRQKLEGYLAWKWGLEANLPSGHPYELAAPETAGATYSQSIINTVSSATSISKSTLKLISNTISSAINISKSITKSIVNTVSSATSTIKSTAKSIINAISSNTSVTKATSKIISNTINVSSTVIKSTSKIISNTISVGNTVTKSMTKIITNNVSTTLSILKKTTKIIVNTVSSVIARVRDGVIGVAKYIFNTKARLRNFTVKKLRTFYYRK